MPKEYLQTLASAEERKLYKEASQIEAEEMGLNYMSLSSWVRLACNDRVERLRKKYAKKEESK